MPKSSDRSVASPDKIIKSTVKLYKKNIVAIEKIDIYCTNMFLLPPILDTI